ncbi:hypothetical protein ACFC18_37910 [Streptomyces sp. NPDC056121]|uniref:hypothetical protein n=1 Tax=Streptomyces TaxID=1883 RepID=UPI001D0B542D|nr:MULTISPECIES: hypothetical protein [Streptomyces]MCX5085014.1 hypothetical protein [Streptomyces sp. NBC_00401]UDM03713.1 hypothetical protein LGI35_38410 [Streptomyces longhuiensis]
MVHHHKSNRAVEGDPDARRGMPLRPNMDELERRTQEDLRDVGLRVKKPERPAKQYEAIQNQVDREVDSGEMPSGKMSRAQRDAFPPTRYDR